MISTSLTELSAVLGAKLIGENCVIDAVSTDTRTLSKGALFVALIGEKFDAHNFAEQARENGASALLVNRELPTELPQLVVEDTLVALGALGSWVHKKCDIQTLAITGSCGKTTVKEMVTSILNQKGKVLATAGNFNNDIGCPLTLLCSEPDHDYAVIELGANHIGEIAYTTALVKPSLALVNNVAESHLEGFGSMDGVKQAKGEIYQGLSESDVAVVNLDSNGEHFWEDILSDKKVVTFSTVDQSADYYPTNIVLNDRGEASFILHSPEGEVDVQLGIVGQHNVGNALAAAALAMNFSASLEEVRSGLAELSNVKGRVETHQLTEKVKLIDDSYNASVPAMKAAVDLLSTYSGQRWLILGYMAELGEESLALHRQVGEHAAPFKFEHVLTFGEDTKVISDVCNGLHFDTHDELLTYIEQNLYKDSVQVHTLLVKGANSARMSTVAEALKENYK
ncbi:UDP-N-acetylmuramoyl-tripeptide--D-alanyl-D-alanine ligase [Vibrio hannami]|uniref:UDP-N-acetylmuramoyl-tripeptide--D-alanyl-D- alanine ligase n=1 Tax=Vibrio hannami TaxID=2717094 RepID=UPI00241071A7|nr:UDP-N-acetylmuramoyl-tripeptide--D-alanyl-D-alanine ligase [Vibrio hannami]MDG3089061.1 UDP-N-acetylmuramoyl-tripeptide--D-alanyl-D-alanine ligase [Vibrio hannami]